MPPPRPPSRPPAPDHHGGRRHEQPEQERPGTDHEDLGRVEVAGQEAQADARDHGDERADVVARQVAEVLQVEPVDGERPRGDGHHAGGQAVEAVDQVDGVGDGDDPQRGEERGPLGRQLTKPASGTLNWNQVTPMK